MNRLLILSIILLLSVKISQAQGHAIIIFEGERTSNTRTYLCKLKKGDPYRLDNYLQSGTTDQGSANDDKAFAPKEYEPRSDRNEMKHLSEIYDVDEKKLKKGKEKQRQKYFEEKEKAYQEKRETKPQKQKSDRSAKAYLPQRARKTKLARQFKLSSRRIKEGQKKRVPAGNVNLIIKFETRENNTVKSYLTSLNTKLEPGKKYVLKYYGNENRRKYFIEAYTGKQ